MFVGYHARAQTDGEGEPVGGEDTGYVLDRHGGTSHWHVLRLL